MESGWKFFKVSKRRVHSLLKILKVITPIVLKEDLDSGTGGSLKIRSNGCFEIFVKQEN